MDQFFQLNPETAPNYMSQEVIMGIMQTVVNHVSQQEDNNCYWCVCDNVELLKKPEGMEQYDKFRVVVPTNFIKGDCYMLAIFVYPEAAPYAKDAVRLVKAIFENKTGLPIHENN